MGIGQPHTTLGGHTLGQPNLYITHFMARVVLILSATNSDKWHIIFITMSFSCRYSWTPVHLMDFFQRSSQIIAWTTAIVTGFLTVADRCSQTSDLLFRFSEFLWTSKTLKLFMSLINHEETIHTWLSDCLSASCWVALAQSYQEIFCLTVSTNIVKRCQVTGEATFLVAH